MLPNHSCLRAIEDELFLQGTRMLSSFEKVNRKFQRNEFQKECRQFLDGIVSTILSTVDACSLVGQGPSCFYTEIVLETEDCFTFHFFGQLSDGLMQLGRVRGSEIEAAKAEFHSFAWEQQQMEESDSRSRAPINSVLAFCKHTGFRSRRPPYKVSIGWGFWIMYIVLWFWHLLFSRFLVFPLTILVFRGSSELHANFIVSLLVISIDREQDCDCVHDFALTPLLTQRNFFSVIGKTMLNTAIA